jgi:hypothetical protein
VSIARVWLRLARSPTLEGALTDGRCARARAGGQSQSRTVTSWSGSEATCQPW